MSYLQTLQPSKAKKEIIPTNNLNKTDQSLKNKLPQVAVCKIDNPNSPISYQDNEIHNLKPPQKEVSRPRWLHWFKESLKTNYHSFYKSIPLKTEDWALSHSFYEALP